MTKESSAARDKLAKDLQAVIGETEELLKATAGQGGEKIESLRAHVEETLESAKSRMGELEDAVLENVKSTAKATDQYVHENPWPAVGIAAGIGLIVGLMLARK